MCVSNVFCTENQTKLVAQQNAKPTLKKNRSALASRSRNTALNAQLYRDQLVKIINVPEVSLQRLFGLLVYNITKMYLFQEQTVLTVIDESIVGFLEDEHFVLVEGSILLCNKLGLVFCTKYIRNTQNIFIIVYLKLLCLVHLTADLK